MRVGYEALAWGRHVDDHRDAWEVVRRADHRNIGLVLDSFHTMGRGIDHDTIRCVPGEKIFCVQLADAPKIDMDLLYWLRHFRNMTGEGDFDIATFTRAVLATGYRGPLSLDIFTDQFTSGSAPVVARNGYRALFGLVDDVKHAEPQCLPDHAALPVRVKPNGVAFMEFVSRGAEACMAAFSIFSTALKLSPRFGRSSFTRIPSKITPSV
ncbi:sugar phosphate isomerase/epimerase family protein [Phaeobacter sp. C3_T13_0]|uniref:sugar phosphate isomerase/epimerase family protein n=1 Tax=Phaeobacter cretensis TaxID=3342641 RepID=UPI0039BCEFB9